jgi:hypothetical protein
LDVVSMRCFVAAVRGGDFLCVNDTVSWLHTHRHNDFKVKKYS